MCRLTRILVPFFVKLMVLGALNPELLTTSERAWLRSQAKCDSCRLARSGKANPELANVAKKLIVLR
jgi:hypothetical protein